MKNLRGVKGCPLVPQTRGSGPGLELGALYVRLAAGVTRLMKLSHRACLCIGAPPLWKQIAEFDTIAESHLSLPANSSSSAATLKSRRRK